MIILNATQATRVRGISPTFGFAALQPVPLKDGTFMLPEAVLTDPAHLDVRAFLTPLPRATVLESNKYTNTQADRDALIARNIPTFQSAGVRT